MSPAIFIEYYNTLGAPLGIARSAFNPNQCGLNSLSAKLNIQDG